MSKEKLCEAEVKRNIVLVELGKPLTLPLAKLNRSCEFKKVWEETYDKWHPNDSKEFWVKRNKKVYYQRPEVKTHHKTYMKDYYQKHKLKKSWRNYE